MRCVSKLTGAGCAVCRKRLVAHTSSCTFGAGVGAFVCHAPRTRHKSNTPTRLLHTTHTKHPTHLLHPTQHTMCTCTLNAHHTCTPTHSTAYTPIHPNTAPQTQTLPAPPPHTIISVSCALCAPSLQLGYTQQGRLPGHRSRIQRILVEHVEHPWGTRV